MLVNEHGLLICLLNKWELEKVALREPNSRKSRGQLVWSMAQVSEFGEIEGFLGDLGTYPAFTLVAFSDEEERCWEWDGVELSGRRPQMPLTSSSYRFEDVRAARASQFLDGLRGRAYHAAVNQEASAYSVRMCRPDAQTWSRSVVRVGEKVSWEYLAEQPELDGEPQRTFVELARR